MDALVVLPEIALIGLCFLLVPALAGTYLVARGSRGVTCPDNQELVDIKVDPKRATRRLFSDCHHDVATCARWPEKASCDQGCVKEP